MDSELKCICLVYCDIMDKLNTNPHMNKTCYFVCIFRINYHDIWYELFTFSILSINIFQAAWLLVVDTHATSFWSVKWVVITDIKEPRFFMSVVVTLSQSFIMYLKAHQFLQQGCFFFRYSFATSVTNWAQLFTDLLFFDTSSENSPLSCCLYFTFVMFLVLN